MSVENTASVGNTVRDGAKIGNGFVTASEAKEGLRQLVRKYVGPRTNMAPDLVFAIAVIRQTIPKSVLKGEKLRRYERALQILSRMRDELCQVETTIDIFWKPGEE